MGRERAQSRVEKRERGRGGGREKHVRARGEREKRERRYIYINTEQLEQLLVGDEELPVLLILPPAMKETDT
jgi:hypothetical protein